MRPSVVCGVVIVFILLEGVDCACEKFGDSRYGTIFIYENGTFRTDTPDNKNEIDATDITGITIKPGDDNFGEHFKASLVGEKWVLMVEPTLSDWYDGRAPGFVPSVPLVIVYAGCSDERPDHTVAISGNNNRAPVFNNDNGAYSATITKLMPTDVPLHFVDSSLDITAKDGDFVCETDNCNTGDESNNVVSCFVDEDPREVIKCEAKLEENGSYRMFVSLKKTIDDITETSYAFKLSAKDGGSPPQSSDLVTVTLNFPPEDIHPPTFSKQFYSAEMIKTKPTLPEDIIAVSAVDGDPEINADITYTVLESSPPCPDCFTFSASMLQLTKPLTQEMVLSRLVTVVVQATEAGTNGRQSTVTVNIPIAGDDNNPKLTDFYQTELVKDGDTWTIGTIETFTPTDDDTMLENDQYKFRLIGDDSALFQLSQAQGPESNLQLINGFDIASLPADGDVSFFIEVSEVSDESRSSRSMITVKYPASTEPTTTKEPSTTTTTNAQETTTPCECPTTTECPVVTTPVTTACPDVTTQPCECTTTETTECPETTVTPCDCTTHETTNTTPTTTQSTTTPKPTPTGSESVSFISGDNDLDTQHVGYPGFIQLQNAVPMPIAKVSARCSLDWCNSFVTYSMQSEHFFIDQSSGEIFLINNAGSGSIQDTCRQPCSVQVFADLSNLDVPRATLTVSVAALSENQILVLDSSSSYTDPDTILANINSAADVKDKFWFRLINIQPKEEEETNRQTSKSIYKSILFVTANKMDENIFVDKETAAGIINGAMGEDVTIDDTIQVNNEAEDTSGGGNNTAVVVLSVILALVILAVLVALVFIKRKFFLSLIPKKKTESAILESSTENSSIVASKEDKPRRNSKGLFNLQSVTIQTTQPTNNPRGRPAVGGNTQSGVMREMSTELEKRLETKGKPENPRPQHTHNTQNTKQAGTKKSSAPMVPIAPKPAKPSQGGIKFNERAEVMEVEKTKRLSISSGTSDSSADSSSSGSSISSGYSAANDDEKVTRI